MVANLINKYVANLTFIDVKVKSLILFSGSSKEDWRWIPKRTGKRKVYAVALLESVDHSSFMTKTSMELFKSPLKTFLRQTDSR